MPLNTRITTRFRIRTKTAILYLEQGIRLYDEVRKAGDGIPPYSFSYRSFSPGAGIPASGSAEARVSGFCTHLRLQ